VVLGAGVWCWEADVWADRDSGKRKLITSFLLAHVIKTPTQNATQMGSKWDKMGDGLKRRRPIRPNLRIKDYWPPIWADWAERALFGRFWDLAVITCLLGVELPLPKGEVTREVTTVTLSPVICAIESPVSCTV
jgi:hypothetical protein